jgi:hypothetical protein
MNDPADDSQHPTACVDPRVVAQLSSLEARFALFRQAYCRELIREDRLDWDAFSTETNPPTGLATDNPPTIPGRTPTIKRRVTLRRPWTGRRRG